MKTAGIGISADQSARIAAAAQKLGVYSGRFYARDEAPPSPYAGLSGNSQPGRSRLWWLKGLYKCNQFLGDVLTLAGLRMPTYRMPDGSEHYFNAEALLKRPGDFGSITALSDIRPGDIVLIDWSESGENGAHLEIVAEIDLSAQRLRTWGAHKDGAALQDFSWLFRGARFDAQRTAWINTSSLRGQYLVHVLRPLKSTEVLLPGIGHPR